MRYWALGLIFTFSANTIFGAPLSFLEKLCLQVSSEYFFPQFRSKPLPERKLDLDFPIYQFSVATNFDLLEDPKLVLSLLVDIFQGEGNGVNIKQDYFDINVDSRRTGFYMGPGLIFYPYQRRNWRFSLEAYFKLGRAHETIAAFSTHNNIRVKMFESDYTGDGWALVPKSSLELGFNYRHAVALSVAYQYSKYMWNSKWDYLEGKNFDVPYYTSDGYTPKDLGNGLAIGFKYLFRFQKEQPNPSHVGSGKAPPNK